MTDQNDTHDKLAEAYLEYFRANEKFEQRNSVRTHRYVRKCLRDIRLFAKERMDEIHDHHNTTRKTKTDSG
jgi:hypothetical protein|tara:strand:+ start:646 stop:858 length:213 start_codon:yes stop_codon:yes gene_type:complete